MDAAISTCIQRKYKIAIGARAAEQLKIELGSAFPLEEEKSIEVQG
jgi:rod shape-determining protein MreB